ncbi:hypothetical protein ACWF9G_19695 [Nocardia sp. NPDC055029]
MSDCDPFFTIYRNPTPHVLALGGNLQARYLGILDMVAVSTDGGALYLSPAHAAELIDMLTGALNSYAATLRVVA